jgi:hypothetical protein
MNARSALTWSRIAANIGIPLVVVVIGGCYTQAVRDSEIRARYVELAIGVLRESPSNKSQTPNIRAWAVKVIEELSPIKLSPDAQEELKKQPLPGNDFFRRHNVGATMTPPVERR